MDNFTNSPQDEQKRFLDMMPDYQQLNPYEFRVGFGRRFGSAILDYLFLTLLSVVAFGVAGIISDITAIDWANLVTNPVEMEKVTQQLMKSIYPISILITVIYYSMEIFFQASVGKMILGIKIGSEDRKHASMSSLFIRFAIKNISTIFLILFVISGVKMLSSLSSLGTFFVIIAFFFTLFERKQALYDRWSKTAVYFKDELINE